MPREADREEILAGGYTNAGMVARAGDTVRRPQRPTSPSTHALLEHLERAGFPGAPRFLGVDEQGREVLSYVPGDAVLPPLPEWATTDEALVSVAELLRRYHEAVAGFDPAGHAWPHSVPARFRGSLVSHNDPNLDNVIFRDGRAVALIDFDLASPGSAVWELACAARLWVPLRDERDVPEALRGRWPHRLRLLLDAYGLPLSERAEVAAAVPHAHDWSYRIVQDAVAGGHGTFGRLWEEGGRERAQRGRRWFARHGEPLRAAVR